MMANIEKITKARKTLTSHGESQYETIVTRGSGDASTVFKFGIARVKPISAAIPKIAEPATAMIMPRGTECEIHGVL